MAEISRVERAAMQGEPMPTGLTWREVTEYIALRALYWGFKNFNPRTPCGVRRGAIRRGISL